MAQRVFGDMIHIKLDSIPKKSYMGIRKQSGDFKLTTGEAVIYLMQKFGKYEELIKGIWECMNWRKKILRPSKVFGEERSKIHHHSELNLNNSNEPSEQNAPSIQENIQIEKNLPNQEKN